MTDDAERLGLALQLAAGWHAGQTRKVGGGPYVSHLLQVAGLVLDHGGTVDQAVAALLHDAVEDTPATVEAIEDSFGPEVAAIVEHCTDTLPGDSPSAKSPWRDRKERYLARLRDAPADVALVVACDKRHNLSGLVAEARRGGAAAISPPHFNAPAEEQLWYYDGVLDAVVGRIPRLLADDLNGLVAELRRWCRLEDPEVRSSRDDA
jgi:(p)ppGpp synthase/HD superfamily hydrolase